MNEQRKHLRVNHAMEIYISRNEGDTKTKLQTVNVSESGLMFRCEKYFEIMSEYEIAFTLPFDNGKNEVIQCKGVIVWRDEDKKINDYALGMMFTNIDEVDLVTIRSFLETRTK